MDGKHRDHAVLVSAAFAAGAATALAANMVCNCSCSSRPLGNVWGWIARCLCRFGETLKPQNRSEHPEIRQNSSEQPQLHGDSPECQNVAHSESGGVPKEDPQMKEGVVETLYNLPLWFLKNCIVTSEDLELSRIPLLVRNSTVTEKDDVESCYEVDGPTFEELQTLIHKKPSPETSTVAQDWFNYDATILRAPISDDQSGEGFLQAIVQRLASEIGADILMLRSIDIELLCNHFAVEDVSLGNSSQAFDLFFDKSDSGSDEDSEQGSSRRSYTSNSDTTRDSESNGDRSDPAVSEKTHFAFPFHLLLEAHNSKHWDAGPVQQGCGEDGDHGARPLIVLFSEVFSSISSGAWIEVLKQLRRAVEAANSQFTRVMIIGTDSLKMGSSFRSEGDLLDDRSIRNYPYFPYSYRFHSMLAFLGRNPLGIQPMLPRRTHGQQLLLRRHLEEVTTRNNIDMLQESIRKRLGGHCEFALLEPYATWDKSSPDINALESLKRSTLSSHACDYVAGLVWKEVSIERIEKALERHSSLVKWLKNDWSGSRLSPAGQTQWSNLPQGAQNAIERITNDQRRYRWEYLLLDRLVNPDDIKHGWSDIELQDDVKRAISQVVSLSISDSNTQQGILRNSRINGALLYGPPGTGKTHLARVLAREYSAVMIHVSAAEIESKWVGETEKIIKGLFSLATMVAPSIIFIDEADSMFRKRRSHDDDWVRSRVNTLLGQSDGLLQADRPPFLLLATNHPNDMDEAVLRRVPGRLYIGLPTQTARKNMLAIFLREENVAPEVQLGDVAAMTSGFTGSDLHNLCVQAALISQAEAREQQEQDGRRMLRFAHFEDALRHCGPTVSVDAIYAIKEFARKFDSSGMDKIGYSYSEADIAKRMDKGAKKALPTHGERGAGNQVPHRREGEQTGTGEAKGMSLRDWENSEMYPYVTEELCQQWWQEVSE